MIQIPFAARVAPQLKAPIIVFGLVAGGLSAADVYYPVVPHAVVKYAAIGTAALLAIAFGKVASDSEYRDAYFDMVADRRKKPNFWSLMLFGWGLPVGDRVLFAPALALGFEAALLNRSIDHLAASILSFAAFWLVMMLNAAILVNANERRHAPESLEPPVVQ